MYPLSRPGKFSALALSALTLTGCASMNVNSYVERGVDFTQYHTYNWAPDDRLVTGDPRLDNNPFFLERVQADVDQQLASRGFEKTTSETPDLVLHYYASITQQLNLNGTDQKYGCKGCEPFIYDAGTLLFDFVETRTNRVVWRGWAEGSIEGVIDNQAWMEKKIDQIVARILAIFPRRLS